MRLFTTVIIVYGSIFLASALVYAEKKSDIESVSGSQQHDSKLLLRQFSVNDFDQYSPSNAYELVKRIPGFAINEEESQRGLGQASANILINGDRVSGKANGLKKALERIPVGIIVDINIYDGASLGIPGLSGEVINITVNSLGISGTWSWDLQHRDQNDRVDPAYWRGNLSLAGKLATTSWNIGIDNNYQRLGHGGPETVSDGTGMVTERREEYATFDRDRPSIALGLAFNPLSGSTGHLNFSYEQLWQADLEERASDEIAGTLVELDQDFQRRAHYKTIELSGDYAFDFYVGRLKIIALQSNSRQVDNSLRFQYSDPQNDRQKSRREDKLGESIIRSEYSWQANNGDWQWSLESAYNYLDRFLLADNTGLLTMYGDTSYDHPRVNSKVEELRFETNMSYSAPLSPKWAWQFSLGVENSELSQSGDIDQKRNFTRPKGSLGLTFAASNLSNFYFGLSRTVGQLNFSDFLATVDINDGNNDRGNPDLVPHQAWKLEVKLDQNLQSWGALSVSLAIEDIDDIVDRVLTDNSDAVGNIDSSQRYAGRLNGTFELSPIGFIGARLTVDSQYNQSRLKDPISNATRRVSHEMINKSVVELRQDIPSTNLAWGVSFEQANYEPIYRYSKITSNTENNGLVIAYIEDSDFLGMKARFSLRNLSDRLDDETSQTFTPNRGGSLSKTESRARDFGLMYLLSLSGSF
tara:strand:- start:2366 stop:4459 length:2094 start_codon:yes stop_codon:yes gene_type:complete